MRVCVAHDEGRGLMGELPPDVEVVVGDPSMDQVTGVVFWVPRFLGSALCAEGMAGMTDLAVVQLLTAGVDAWLGRLPDHVILCDAQGVHSSSTSEWAVTAILSYLRHFPHFARAQGRGVWAYEPTDELAGKNVLIVGAGDIGAAVAARLAPFEVSLVLVASKPRPGVHGSAELPALLPGADIVVLTVPLTAATTGLVDEAFLSAMRDQALLVNASRGPVVKTDALTAELASGRIGAALDVTDPEPLPAGHPLWSMPNVLLTPHTAASVRGTLRRAYGLVGDQVRRYVAGQPLRNVVRGDY